jgi:hypothetical protein
MRNLLIFTLCAVSVILLLGTATIPELPRGAPPVAVIELPPEPKLDLPPVEHPVVIQVNHQGFPFDLNGEFPYVVMIDNQVYRYDRRAVIEFLEKAVIPHEVENFRSRHLVE